MKKPLIGIVPLVDEARESYWMLPGYMQGVEQAGGVPVMLPLTDDAAALRQLADTCDGFLLTGGQDVSPALYSAAPTLQCGETCPARDAMEARLLDLALAADKPVLGICRGMQMINVFFGGTLYLDLEEQFDGMCAADDVPVPSEGVQTQAGGRVNHWQTKEYGHPTHTVSIMRSSKLGEILGCDTAAENSMHHQGVRALPPNLAAAAYGPDGLVEGVEAKDCRFLMGVQWHPEYFVEDGGHMAPLFRALIDEARQMRCREGRCHDCLRIDREECDPNAVWPAVKFADYI